MTEHRSKIEAYMKENKDLLPPDMIEAGRILWQSKYNQLSESWFMGIVDMYLQDCNKIIEQKRAA